MFVSSNGHTERQRRLGKDVGERTEQEVEMGSFLAKGALCSERRFGTHTYASEGESHL